MSFNTRPCNNSPAEEKGEEAQALPVLRDGETARLCDPEIEDKETRPPPRYKEGTLIEAMQNAWRFVEDEALRERLKEAKGIGTPATRGEIIAGLKKQGFLTVREKNIVPSDRGLALFGVLERADPALVDPGVTAELECLLDDVVLGKQEMTTAIDAVCYAARRIIGRLGEGAAGGHEEVCRVDRQTQGYQAARGLHEVGLRVPTVPGPARACTRCQQHGEHRSNRNQGAECGATVFRRGDRAGQVYRDSRRCQGKCGRDVEMDRHEPAPQVGGPLRGCGVRQACVDGEKKDLLIRELRAEFVECLLVARNIECPSAAGS